MKEMRKVLFLTSALIFLLLSGNARSENSSSWKNPTAERVADIDVFGGKYCLQLLEGVYAEEVIKSFNENLKDKKIDGNISYCRRVINIPIGTARGNHSYGGLCLLETPSNAPQKIMICNGVLVGHFKLIPLKAEEDDVQSLSSFVRDNCFGG